MSNNKGLRLEYRESAFRKRIQTFAIINDEHTDLLLFMNEAFHYFSDQIQNVQLVNALIKVSACLSAEFEKVVQTDDGSRTEKQTIHIQTKNGIVDFATNLERFYQEQIVAHIITQFSDVITTGSGFTLSAINELVVHTNKYQPLHASSYIPLPDFLMRKKAIINVKNKDNMCFKWAVLSALHPSNKAERVSK